MLEPGAVFEVPHALADPPQVARQTAPPTRENRWVLLVSCMADCTDRDLRTVTAVLLSAQVDYQGRHDVLIQRPDGGVARTSIAQTDLILSILKDELAEDRYRGTVLRDTLRQIRARLATSLGIVTT